MSKLLLEFLIRLFAIIANLYPHLLFDNVKDFVKTFVLKDYSQDIIDKNLQLLSDYYYRYAASSRSSKNKISRDIWLEAIIIEINRNLSRKHKYQIIIQLLLFEKIFLRYPGILEKNQLTINELLKNLVEKFKLDEKEYLNCRGFIVEKLYDIPVKDNLLIASSSMLFGPGINFIQNKGLVGSFFFLYIESIQIVIFYYKGNGSVFLNQEPLYQEQIYFLKLGDAIKGQNMSPIYFNAVLKKFLLKRFVTLKLEVDNVYFSFKNSSNGIKRMSLKIESGQLVGIMGRSGVGKSTLLNILNGNIKPQEGTVTINGHDIYNKGEALNGIVGYVPQDDLLISELSVFDNLFLSAQLCFKNMSEEDLTEKVDNLLTELNLFDVKSLQVGTPLNKLISGGQRKKLNLALELIRQPWILFADEPTSGLSSSDAEEIMSHLAGQSFKGCIVVVNIHQPSSDIYKLFDKIIVLDKEGYLTFLGNPVDAIIWFNEAVQRHTSSMEICNKCENVNPEAIFKIIEEKRINEFGEYVAERKTKPAEWHKRFFDAFHFEKEQGIKPLPNTQFNILSTLKQFLVFSKRNLLTKMANMQYITMALLISPLLSAILSFLCRYNHGNEGYVFSQNDNLPPYLFMSVIVAIFVGLILSAEEIFRDKKILYRESFLKLSKLSYLHSKIAYLFLLSALQTFLYVIIGNAILEIHGMIIYFWLILFVTSCFANLLGLLISSAFNSAVVIYIMVPLVMVPQLLLSGITVDFSKLNKYVSSKEVTPFVGDIMVSRWAYEAMIVSQFLYNDYQTNFVEVEKQESNMKFDYLFVIPEIEKAISDTNSYNNKRYTNRIDFIQTQIANLRTKYSSKLLPDFTKGKLSDNEIKLVSDYITILKKFLSTDLNKIYKIKDNTMDRFIIKAGSLDKSIDIKNKNMNNSISELTTKRKSLKPYIFVENTIVRDFEPVYQIPLSNVGRAHFMSSTKIVGNIVIGTLLFNLLAICFISCLVYVILIFYFYFYMK
jgi:ABC transport system ATP-binding/permease protein